MKKKKNAFRNLALLFLILIGFVACDKDFVSLESDVVNSDNTTNFNTDVATYSAITYNKNIRPFQSNGLSANFLGYHNDPIFGTSTASFVSQMSPSAYGQDFGDNIVLDSVVLTIPYFSTTAGTNDEGTITFYELDSVYGSSPIKLSVFQNNYFLRSFDPNSEFQNFQKYYSDGSTSESDAINPLDLEGDLLFEKDAFAPSTESIKLFEKNDDGDFVETSQLAPSIRIKADLEIPENAMYWQDLIFNKEGEQVISNQNNFFEYFRGLYIKAESVGVDGSMMLLNLASSTANITLYYTSDVDDVQNPGETLSQNNTYVLNFVGNKVSLVDNNFISIPEGDAVNGDEKLYLKGGEGSMAIVNLFDGGEDGFSAEFTDFKNDFTDGDTPKRLVNEAFLEFYVDQTTVLGEEEPNRIYLYDFNNNTPLVDYAFDQSVTADGDTKTTHLGPLERVDGESDGEGIKYKVRITEHINSIILRDSTNVKLGLVVSTNVGSINNVNLLGDDDVLSSVPSGTVLSPRGTVVYGNNTTNENKKVKLTIYYTEPEN